MGTRRKSKPGSPLGWAVLRSHHWLQARVNNGVRGFVTWRSTVLHAIWSSDFGAWMCFGGEGLYYGVTSGRVRKPCIDFEVVRPRSCRQTSGSEPSSEGFPPAWAILTDKSNGTRHPGLV